ncbi:magnesium chelatase, subunit ChlI family protein, partial [Candidatus Erwinia dacicola]
MQAARDRQYARCRKVNALMNNPKIQHYCTLTREDAEWLEERSALTGRASRLRRS